LWTAAAAALITITQAVVLGAAVCSTHAKLQGMLSCLTGSVSKHLKLGAWLDVLLCMPGWPAAYLNKLLPCEVNGLAARL
jgi:hypothetical protein